METIKIIEKTKSECIKTGEKTKYYDDYNRLRNIPSINEVLLKGNLTFERLGLNKYPFYKISDADIDRWNKGGEGTKDYNLLDNRPLINDILLEGSLTGHDLGLINEDDVTNIMNTVRDNYIKDGLVNNTNTLSDSEKLKIESWLGLSENYLTYYNETPYQVNDNYNPAHKKYVDESIKVVDDKVKELELFKFPNMTIIGTPTIQNGQVSNFTLEDYLEFPFLVDFRGRPFEINFAFTTGNNVTVQQNILDSMFGLALAIKDGHTLMAISYNGETWSNQYTGTLNIEPNTTYVYKISWNGILYKVQYYNGREYVNDFSFASTQQPYPKQMFIGVSKLSNNYFEGTINLNYANLMVDGNVVWTGMDDVGISSRLATDLSNIDEAGIDYINSLIDTKIGNIDTVLQDIDTGSGV